MVRCWSKKPRDRPTFSSLVAALQTLRDEELARKMLSAGNELAHDGAAEGAQQAKEMHKRADAELAMRLQRELQVEAEQEAGAREFERSLAALERQRDVASIVRGMLTVRRRRGRSEGGVPVSAEPHAERGGRRISKDTEPRRRGVGADAAGVSSAGICGRH
jgi:hypothetical protein